MQAIVLDRARRNGDEPPPYDFHELIGKGAYGRVFKGLNRATKGLVAIKIIDIDRVDYEEMTTKNLQDTLQEIKILQQVKDSRARDYVNIIEEARTVHNELWIISEYASGGSVNTLMKPYVFLSSTGLEEKYIIPIARELAQGLKYIHEAGVIHRDLKCNNILVNEQGRVQLCDFGVSGALEPEITKRSTIVGTPFWMAPELHQEARPQQILYGSEVDIWAYGCTLFEMATGFPPFHTTKPFELLDAGVPKLEGPGFSDGLKDLISYVLQPNAQDRPTASQILEQPYLFDTEKQYPTYTLVQLVENYYRWEQGGGSRASLFNPFGAQAPDPLAPETDDEEDWNFSTSEEFEKQHASGSLPDPFLSGSQDPPFTSFAQPPVDDSRFAQLQAQYRREAADRGGKRLNRLFDQNTTPYRYSAVEPELSIGRPPSDLVLRDFDTGAPNRETVIDLDIALPTVEDAPGIDLGEVPTVRANRNRLTQDSFRYEEEEQDTFDMDQTMRRSTRDSNRFAEQLNRRTMDWKMPGFTEQPNRRTMEWTFNASMAEANQEPMPKPFRLSRRRDTSESLSTTAPPAENRYTQDFVFPPRDSSNNSVQSSQGLLPSSPTLEPGFDDYPRVNSAPGSPLRTSMIDLDMAMVDDDYRPSTSGSASTSTFTTGTETLNGNPFDLEDQVHLSTTNNRASYHMKSQSEPNQAIPGLLTPQSYDELGHPINQDPHHPSMHARGVSSVSQMQAKQPSNVGHGRQRSYQPAWDAWNHQVAYGMEESPPASIATSTSTEEDYDEMWDAYERRVLQSHARKTSGFQSRRKPSQDEDLRSDTDDNYGSEYEDIPGRQSRVSVGPNGRPLLAFPIPRGPEPEALLGFDMDPNLMMNAMWKSTVEMRDGLRSSIDLLKSMHLKETPLLGYLHEDRENAETRKEIEKRLLI
ncbi:kinase-like protein [Aaosphaeria arxii CBS 175.79]|uniref:non-specific serine/threonine protein kinase n=1 Tax=Aaosphaeria arxii CBS 175.79 TaxID=1450172 RepID=A0A6A5XK69_9PLEO|nr:kinase-like protein [Aaosphaeria arxii CBS 175.79]KAF2013353.1 kinase-like protein [Aaosphaeria arxii CBS 175.79]